MRKEILTLIIFFLLIGCSKVDFVLKENNSNKSLKNKTVVVFVGNNNDWFKQEIQYFFRQSEKSEFVLHTNLNEKKINRIVKKNQVAEKIDYELTISYDLFHKTMGCKVFNKKIITKFSFVPKSFGYNFATDRSFEKLYSNSIKKNIRNFINTTPKSNQLICL